MILWPLKTLSQEKRWTSAIAPEHTSATLMLTVRIVMVIHSTDLAQSYSIVLLYCFRYESQQCGLVNVTFVTVAVIIQLL